MASVLIVAAYPPWDFRLLIWVCLIPWFYALSQARSAKEAFAQGLWFSIGMSILGFHWVAYVLHQFGMLPWPFAIIGLFLYSLIGQPQFLLFAPVMHGLRKSRPSSSAGIVVWTIGIAFFYTGIDWALPKLFKDTLGHALYSAPYLRQVADLGGAHLLTFVCFLTGFSLWLLIRERLDRLKRPSPAALVLSGLSVAAIAGIFFYGQARDAEVSERIGSATEHTQAAIIQGNIGDFEKVAAENGIRGAAEKVMATYFTLSDQALSMNPKPDFVIWPETAYPSTFRRPLSTEDYSRDSRIEEFVRNRRFPLLFGSYDRERGKDFNAFYVLAPTPLSPDALNPIHSVGNDLQYYRKHILLMFGEYVPFQDQIPFFNRMFPQVANFGRGIGPDVLNIPIYAADSALKATPASSEPQTVAPARLIQASPLICYEVLFPDYVIAAARKGSQMIVNVTNDSWFGPYGEPHLHLALSVFRSIETRLPMIRGTNTGFSALILQTGEIAERSKLFEPEILNLRVPLLTPPMDTLIKQWGDWFGKFAFFLGCLTLASFWGLSRKRKSSEPH